MNKLADLRRQRGLTQAELATRLGASQKAVQAWEQGRNNPKPAMMQHIEDYFDVPKEKIFFTAFSYKK